MADKVFLIAHCNNNRSAHNSNPAQVAIQARTEKSALTFFAQMFPKRRVTAIGVKGEEG